MMAIELLDRFLEWGPLEDELWSAPRGYFRDVDGCFALDLADRCYSRGFTGLECCRGLARRVNLEGPVPADPDFPLDDSHSGSILLGLDIELRSNGFHE